MSRPPLDGIVLVTGASSGIGVALAREAAAQARVLVLVARRVERLERLALELRAARPELVVELRPCDLSDSKATRALAQDCLDVHGGIDVLVNCAGLGDVSLLEVADPDKLEHMLAVNITALTLLTRAMLPGMVQRGRGGVLNVSSGFGLTWLPGFAAYAGSKHYVSIFSEALRAELAGTGVVVTHLCPGPVATEFVAVAGNPTGQDVPAFIEMSPEACARSAWRGFARGRARVIPGLLIPGLLALGTNTPLWLLRLLYGGLAIVSRPRLPHVPGPTR